MNDSQSEKRFEPTQDEVARCAFLIWKSEGEPNGRDLKHWFEAEMQLQAELVKRFELDANLPSFPELADDESDN